MQRTETVAKTLWYSKIHPELVTEHPKFGAAIEWADENPVVWKIVRGTKSKPFGRNASTYMGCDRGDSLASAISRAAYFKMQIEPHFDPPASDKPATFWMWRARFTLEHYADKGFKGGFFQQWDGQYDRCCCDLDYTPGTLNEVVARFLEWCGNTFKTVEVRVDGKSVWVNTEGVK